MRLGETVTLSTERRPRFENCCRGEWSNTKRHENKEEGVVRYSIDLGDKSQKKRWSRRCTCAGRRETLTGTDPGRAGAGWMRMC